MTQQANVWSLPVSSHCWASVGYVFVLCSTRQVQNIFASWPLMEIFCAVFKRKFWPRHKRLEATQSATFISLMLVWFVWNLLNERALRHRLKCKVLWNAEYLYLNIQYGYMSRTLNLTGTHANWFNGRTSEDWCYWFVTILDYSMNVN